MYKMARIGNRQQHKREQQQQQKCIKPVNILCCQIRRSLVDPTVWLESDEETDGEEEARVPMNENENVEHDFRDPEKNIESAISLSQVSISSMFFARLFHTNIFLAAFFQLRLAWLQNVIQTMCGFNVDEIDNRCQFHQHFMYKCCFGSFSLVTCT